MSKQYEADAFKKTGGTASQYLMANGTTSTGPSGGVDVGTGTANKVAKFSDSDTITDSIITDDGTSVGIGVSGSSAKLHVKASNSGASAVANGTFIVEAGSAPSIQILSANTQTQFIKFGDPQDGDAGGISYSHSTNEMKLRTNGGDKVTIDSDGQMGIGTDDPDVMLDVSTSTYANAFVPIQDLKYSTFDVMKLGYTGSTGSIRKGTIDTAAYGFSVNTGDGTERFVIDSAGVGTFNGPLTIESDTDTILKLNNSDNGPQYVTFSRSNDRHAYFGFGGSSDNFTIMSEETGGQIILGTAATTRVTIEADGDVVIGANTTSASFIKSGGTSSQFLKADGSVDSNTYAVGTIPTDFVSAAGGGIFEGDITADAVIVAGGTSTRFLKADGSLDANTYMTGAGSSGNLAFYIGTNEISDTSALAWDAITDTLNIDGDLEVTGDIDCDSITSDNYINIPQTFQSNFVHTGGNSYMNVPFNSLSDNASGGEMHFIVTPYQGYVHSVAFKNTATGNAMTGTNMNFRVLRNGTTIYTSTTQTFTAAARTYKGWVLGSTDATFFAGNDLRFQFKCTSGLWQDTCAVVVLKCII